MHLLLSKFPELSSPQKCHPAPCPRLPTCVNNKYLFGPPRRLMVGVWHPKSDLGGSFSSHTGRWLQHPSSAVLLRKELIEQILTECLQCVKHSPKRWCCSIHTKGKAPDFAELTFSRSVSMFGAYGTHPTNTANLWDLHTLFGPHFLFHSLARCDSHIQIRNQYHHSVVLHDMCYRQQSQLGCNQCYSLEPAEDSSNSTGTLWSPFLSVFVIRPKFWYM